MTQFLTPVEVPFTMSTALIVAIWLEGSRPRHLGATSTWRRVLAKALLKCDFGDLFWQFESLILLFDLFLKFRSLSLSPCLFSGLGGVAKLTTALPPATLWTGAPASVKAAAFHNHHWRPALSKARERSCQRSSQVRWCLAVLLMM